METLEHKAYILYDLQAGASIFYAMFTKDELITLWKDYCVYRKDDNGMLTGGASFDDEVYDALSNYNYFNEKKEALA